MANKKPDPSRVSPTTIESTRKPLLRTFSLRPGGIMTSPSVDSITTAMPNTYRYSMTNSSNSSSRPTAGVGNLQQKQHQHQEARQLASKQKLIDEYNSKRKMPDGSKSSGIFSVSQTEADDSHDLFNDQSSQSSQSLNNSIDLTHDSPSTVSSQSSSFTFTFKSLYLSINTRQTHLLIQQIDRWLGSSLTKTLFSLFFMWVASDLYFY